MSDSTHSRSTHAYPELIFCGGGNKRYAEIAIDNGYRYGARLPGTTYADIYFADQNWKKPNRKAYMAALKRLRPYMATVIDWEREEQYPEVIDWAAEAAQFVQVIVIIPKVHNAIYSLPRSVGAASVRLGYSVPTKHGGTDVFLSEYLGWDIHLLGGSPGKQMLLSRYLNVKSADGNMAMKMANTRGLYWKPGKSFGANSWTPLREKGKPVDANYRAFELSCKNIHQAWMMENRA